MQYAPVKMLAVDREQLLLWALERACSARGMEVTTALSSLEAIEVLEKQHYDLFMIDFDLKDQSRFELLEVMDEQCPYVPIIIMTSNDITSCELNDAIRETRKNGAWHLLEKPFSLDTLLCFIEVIFRDQGHVKVCLNSLQHNYESEKRREQRRAHVKSVNYSFEKVIDGSATRVLSKGILTDISSHGSCMLTNELLQQEQIISIKDDSLQQCGRVSWCTLIEEDTFRCGLQFC